MKIENLIIRLHSLADPSKILFKENKFGIVSNSSLGIYHKDLRDIAKEIGKNNELAVELFYSGVYEARILCSKIFDVKHLTEELMDKWVITFENWEICDSFCMGLFAKSQFAVKKALEYTSREEEFQKRAGFTIIAAYCMAGKNEENKVFEDFLKIIKRESHDDRTYVKKAVNWALRNIGKRNIDLKKKAIIMSVEIGLSESKCAKWISKNALKELQDENRNMLDYPRCIYRK